MQKWQYAVLWFVRDVESLSVEVRLYTSGEPRSLGATKTETTGEIDQAMMFSLDSLGDDGWEAYAFHDDRVFLKRPVE
jgi:hypothetical protein